MISIESIAGECMACLFPVLFTYQIYLSARSSLHRTRVYTFDHEKTFAKQVSWSERKMWESRTFTQHLR